DSLEFALSVAESARHPERPKSPVGIAAEDINHTPVTVSYGSDQMIEVVGRKGTRPNLYYQINGGDWERIRLEEGFGRYYNDAPGLFYTRYTAEIKGQVAGDTVSYKIRSRTNQLGPYQYNVPSVTGNPILLVAGEDYTGEYPVYDDPSGPNYLHFYTAALDAAGYAYDIWNVDLQGVPSHTEVLSHYKVAIWYSGDDYWATVPDRMSTHADESVAFRDFLNYSNGKLFVTGQDLAYISAVYGQFDELPDDLFQYNLGAYLDIDSGGINPDNGDPFDVRGQAGDPVFDGLNFRIQGGSGADNQGAPSSFLSTNYFLPHFEGTVAARYDRPGGPFDPISGEYYVYSQIADRAFKRLGRTITLPDGNPELTFWVSYDIESDWDYAFVEIVEAGTDNWTTLPDLNGLTTTDTGFSCTNADGWVNEIHPFLAHYMDADCNPSGTSGEWNAFTGGSDGWRQVVMDLSAYAGKTVEIYLSYASDWAVQNLGVFVEDIEISGQPLEDFEAGLGGWAASVPPGSNSFNNWERITNAGFPEGPAMRTADSVYLGFGFEAIDTSDNRTAVMDRVMQYLLPTGP
ncbi:MAG: zinc carboxypeptidase, partial [Desulfobacteraceae bacterium]|nr:zinc carboxypeptidase [Desulfobacteraceae bacterium]